MRAFVLLCLWAVFHFLFSLFFQGALAFICITWTLPLKPNKVRFFESVLKMWGYEKLIQFENAPADSQPSLKIDFILNVPQAPLSLHTAMITARQIKTLNHLRHVNVRRRYGEDCFMFRYRVETLLPILVVKRGQLVPPRGRARRFAICRQKKPRCISSNPSCCQ